ncbi:MAG: hypothetical protein HYU69_12105 [Bacteroidetes bacterium]|nr:hypothetical protein [Bacteroidota bacterium]
MKEFRDRTMKRIIQSADVYSVEYIIRAARDKMIENGINSHIIKRFIEKLELALTRIEKSKVNEKEWNNVKRAMEILKTLI